MFLMVGVMKLIRTKEKLSEMMTWVEDFSQAQIRGIAILEIIGAAGLILPPLLNGLPILAPVAAVGLALTMVGAFVTHLRRKELVPMGALSVVLFAMSIFVAFGRFFAAPYY